MQKLAAINTGSTGSNTLFTNSSTIFWKVSNNFDISSDFTQAVASPINAASTSAVITFMTGGISIFSRFSGPAYLTALGTMSSAATLGIALECARKSPILRKEISDVTIPLFANIHLCGSILTETVFVLTVSQMLYGSMPSILQITLFILLLGLFAIGAPGVPGGTVLASLGLIISVLHFDEAGTALLLTIFALQDSFGTACNITGDGALTLITDTFEKK